MPAESKHLIPSFNHGCVGFKYRQNNGVKREQAMKPELPTANKHSKNKSLFKTCPHKLIANVQTDFPNGSIFSNFFSLECTKKLRSVQKTCQSCRFTYLHQAKIHSLLIVLPSICAICSSHHGHLTHLLKNKGKTKRPEKGLGIFSPSGKERDMHQQL